MTSIEQNYTEKFKKFVEKGVGERYFIGTGNPNADILFVGKESAISSNNSGEEWYCKNAINWKGHIDNKTCERLNYTVDENHPFRKEKSWGKNTWSKYQVLYNHIYDKKSKPYYIDFLEKVFTTEINDAPNKNTATADKNSLKGRKELFKDSSFLKDFSVIVLACSNYIKNNNSIREIDDIFSVKYIGDEKGKYCYSRGNWFFIHLNNDNSKMVIHTRQLSMDVNNELLSDMGGIIRKHLYDLKLIE